MATIGTWDLDPIGEFRTFVTSVEFLATSRRAPASADPAPISDDSAAVYCFMFGKFVAWMAAHDKKMSTVDQEDMFAFLKKTTDGHRDLNSKIAYRYLRLLERCYRHLQVYPNPAQHAIFGAMRQQIGSDQEMFALTRDQRARFMAELPVHNIQFPTGKPFEGWKRRRDRAMQLMMLCAGLTVSEVIGMLIDEVGRQPGLDGTLALNLTPAAKQKTSYEHRTVVQKEAVPDLLAWLDERQQLPCPGSLLFPGNLEGTPLNRTSVYRQVKGTFERAGIDIARSGGRTLRNSFAVQEIDEGTSAAELAEHLGLALERSVDAYAITRARLK